MQAAISPEISHYVDTELSTIKKGKTAHSLKIK